MICWKRLRKYDDSVPEGVVAVHAAQQDIPAVLRDYRPRSRTIDALHHKFGMNEIETVTVKEGGDLVRIARPLETEGEERKLSEELLGITNIIPNENARTRQTNDTSLKTGSEGEEESSP